MKRFIRKFLVFASIGTIPFAILLAVFYFNTNSKVNKRLDEISTYETLILGDSQMQRISPSCFTQETYNFASAGEHYFFTFCKARKILALIP